MGNNITKKQKKCRCQQKLRKDDGYSGYNTGYECFGGTEWPCNRGGYCKNAHSYQKRISDGLYIQNMYGNLTIHQQDMSDETEYIRESRNMRKKIREREKRRERNLRCRQHLNSSLDSGSESSSTPHDFYGKYSYQRKANTSAQNCIWKNNTGGLSGDYSSFQTYQKNEIDNLMDSKYEHPNTNVRIGGQKRVKSVLSNTDNASSIISKKDQIPDQNQMTCKVENKTLNNSVQSGENINSNATPEKTRCRQDLRKERRNYREPVQIEGFIQQENTGRHSGKTTTKSYCIKPCQTIRYPSREITDNIDRSGPCSCFLTSNTNVSEAFNSDHYRNGDSIAMLNSYKTANKFDNQTNVVSVRTNTLDIARKINHDALKSDERGMCPEFENRPESEDFNECQRLHKANALTEVDKKRSCGVSSINISPENACAASSDCETTQKHRFDDLIDENERPGKRLLTETGFDYETDASDTLSKHLQLRSDIDTDEVVLLKLPGPSFSDESTELKRLDKTPLVEDIDQIPSSGYPFNTSNSDFQVQFSHDSFMTVESEEELDTFADTAEQSKLVKKTISSTSNKAEHCLSQLQQPGVNITISNASNDRAMPSLNDESDFLIKSNLTSDSQGHENEETDCLENICVEFDRINDNDCDIVNASTTCNCPVKNGIKSVSKKVPAEVNKCSSAAKNYFENEDQECTSKTEDPYAVLCEQQKLADSNIDIKELSTIEKKQHFSAPDNAVTSQCVSKFSSLPMGSRKRNNSESCDSDYCSVTTSARSLDSTTLSERNEKTSLKMEINANYEGHLADKTSLAKFSSMMLEENGCKNISHNIFDNQVFDFIPINSFNCSDVFYVKIDSLDVSNTRVVKVSDEGILQDVKLSHLIKTQIIETDSTSGEEECKTQEPKSDKCTNRKRNVDWTYKERNEDDCFTSEQNGTTKWTACSKKLELLNSIVDETFNVGKPQSYDDVRYLKHRTNFLRYSHSFTKVHEFHGFSNKIQDLDSEKDFYAIKALSQTDLLNIKVKTQVHEFHGFSNKIKDLDSRKDTYAIKALSETDLSNIKVKQSEWHSEIILNTYSHVDDQTKSTGKLDLKKGEAENSVTCKEDHRNDSDSQLGHGQFSKTFLPTPPEYGKRKKKLTKKKKKTLKPETCSFSSWQSLSQTFSESLSNSYRRNNAAHKRKGQRSWNQSFARHQRSRKLRSEISVGYIDSGIGVSYKSGNTSIQYVITKYKNLSRFKCFKGKWLVESKLRKGLSCLTKKKSKSKYIRKCVEHFFERRGKRVTKSVVRNFFGRLTTNLQVQVLESFFQRVSTGSPPSTQERMQYEWLRLATFHNYAGNGNSLALARNGFYHDHTEGPTTTRCYLCDARHYNWQMFDNVNAEHRRQSPNCPFHENSGHESVNISITSGDSEGEVSAQTRTSAPTVTSVNTTVTASSTASSIAAAASSSAAAVSEAMRSLQMGQASSSGGESISQQPTEDPESGDRSLLALSQPRRQQVLGRSGQAYSTIIAPRRNNVATGARNGIDPLGSSSSTSSTTRQNPGIRPSSILGGPVGAGAFAGLDTGALAAVSRASEGLQQNAPSSSTEAAAGARQTNPAPGAGGRTDPTITVLVDNPKHPDYINIDSRVSSYQGWPDYLDQTPRQMSEAGFFFVGVADFTRCFCCGGGLRNWEPGDDPMLEHTRWFPRCEYVNKLKGERYVAAVQRRHQEHMTDQQRQQIEISQIRDENRNPPDPMTTEAAAVLREMGYSAERTKEAILAVRRQIGSALVTTQQVLSWLLDDEERRLTGNSSNTELGIRPAPSSTATSISNTSTPSSIVYTGTSISSSIVYTGTSIGTSIIDTTSSISTATSIVSAGTTTSTSASSVSTTATAEVKQSGTPAGAGSSGTGNQKTGSGNSSSSNSASGSSVEKQSGASGGDSDGSKAAAKEGASSSETKTKTTKKKNAKKKAKNKATAKSETAGATGGDVDAKSLKAENEKLREMQTCKICMERAVNTTLLPCGHLVCCDTCAARLQRCPICRKRIKGTVKTFMS